MVCACCWHQLLDDLLGSMSMPGIMTAKPSHHCQVLHSYTAWLFVPCAPIQAPCVLIIRQVKPCYPAAHNQRRAAIPIMQHWPQHTCQPAARPGHNHCQIDRLLEVVNSCSNAPADGNEPCSVHGLMCSHRRLGIQLYTRIGVAAACPAARVRLLDLGSSKLFQTETAAMCDETGR